MDVKHTIQRERVAVSESKELMWNWDRTKLFCRVFHNVYC